VRAFFASASWVPRIAHSVCVPEYVQLLFVACPHLLSIWGCASPASPTMTPSSLEDMIDAFSDARQKLAAHPTRHGGCSCGLYGRLGTA
jgi:hypothetical protein